MVELGFNLSSLAALYVGAENMSDSRGIGDCQKSLNGFLVTAVGVLGIHVTPLM